MLNTDLPLGRVRTVSSETEDIYQIPSGSSSSGFSDSVKEPCTVLPVFVHHDNFSGVPNGVRNAMIYGTLMRDRSGTGGEKLLERNKTATVPKKSLLMAVNDNKPSVWEQYYGMKANAEGTTKQTLKPSDVPIFVSTILHLCFEHRLLWFIISNIIKSSLKTNRIAMVLKQN